MRHLISAEDPTVQEVYDLFTPEQQDVVHYMIGAALESVNKEVEQSAISDNEKDNESNPELAHTETIMKRKDVA